MNKLYKRIDQNDIFRVVMTDLLPNELPRWFSNYKFYNLLKERSSLYNSGKVDKDIIKTELKKTDQFKLLTYIIEDSVKKDDTQYFIPLDYKINKNKDLYRSLSIMHPYSQIDACFFYKDNSYLIQNFCTRSNFSIRHPIKISKRFYYNELESNRNFQGIETTQDIDSSNLRDTEEFCSYFIYSKYSMMYKFFESTEYLKLEKKFTKLIHTDISACFYSIYTHSISWATTSKEFAKYNKSGTTFGDTFDKLMREQNYKETNGIIVGPELSRIFAEIIMQRIDIDIESKALIKEIIINKDYAIKRYVDDYFIFFNNDEFGKILLSYIDSSLMDYNLTRNISKTNYYLQPFISKITVCKTRLSKTIGSLFEFKNEIINNEKTKNNGKGILKKENFKNFKLKNLSNYQKTANKIIREIKVIVFDTDVAYYNISGYLFSIIINQVMNIIKYVTQQTKELSVEELFNTVNWFLVIIDVSNFILHMDFRFQTVEKYNRIVANILKCTNLFEKENMKLQNKLDEVYQKIFFEIRAIITNNYKIISKETNIVPIEILNLLYVTTQFPKNYKFSDDFLKNHLMNETIINPYFTVVTLLFYINEDYGEYTETTEEIQRQVLKYLKDSKNFLGTTEIFLLLFDYLSCPYVLGKYKNQILGLNYFCKTLRCDIGFQNKIIKEIEMKNGNFINWTSDEDLLESLLKRKYIYPYE